MFKKYFYILYFLENDQPATIIESIEELQKFLGYKNLESTRSALCHHIKGDNGYLRDQENRKYKAVKVWED